MEQYGTGQNVPYSGKQESDLVSNPRYTGQSGGTNPLGHDGRGPADESRYGAAPLSTTGVTPGGGQVWPSPAAPPNAHRGGVDEYGNPRREGVVDKMKDAVGMGPHSGATGHGTPGYDNYGNPTGHGTPGYDNYGNPRREGMVDKVKDAVGMGPHSGATGHGTPGYDNYGNPRREGVVDAAGMGPHSGATGHGTPGYDNYGNPRREGVVDAAGMGPHSGATGYGTPGYDNYGNPRREGVVDKVKDAVGMGPHSGATGHPHGTTGYDQSGFGTGHPHGTTGYDQSGFGTGHHHDGVHVVPGNIPVAAMGERRVEPGYDASKGQFGHNHQGTLTGGPRKEGIVEKIKDAVGMGKHDAHPGTTTTGTYGTGTDHGLHGNTTTPGSYSHNHMVDTGLGHERHPGSSTGYPHETMGVDQTYPHETMGERVQDAVGVGPHHNTDYERTGKGFEDRTGMMHDKTSGYDATRTGTGYDDSNVDYSHNDATTYGVDGAPPKKGMMAKIKDKLHH